VQQKKNIDSICFAKVIFLFKISLFELFWMQNRSLNYCNWFRLTTFFQSTIKQIYLIFVDALLILNKILLTLILNFFYRRDNYMNR